jgi:hypothetical protein
VNTVGVRAKTHEWREHRTEVTEGDRGGGDESTGLVGHEPYVESALDKFRLTTKVYGLRRDQELLPVL